MHHTISTIHLQTIDFHQIDHNILNNHSGDDLSLIISSIKKDIDGYCNNHEQFDDITMLCLRYL